VDLVSERGESGVDEVLATLDRELIGLTPVKTRVAEIAALLLVDRMRTRFGLTAPQPSLHMCFTGNPGTGKTTVANRMADLLHRLGYLRRGHLVSVTRDDLVGEYVGHTAPKTKDVIKRAMGGVLFIDEAYYLYKVENERDYGGEAIEILLQVMENNRDDLVVILAGYADKMDQFFSANPGMQSRVAHHITFPDYTAAELEDIAALMVDGLGYRFSDDARVVFGEYLRRRREQPWFANARSVRNAVERARLRHARRLIDGPMTSVGVLELTTIEAEDLLASRVFDREAQ
jgi:probable Rubsico expression protein CbbX